MKLTKPQRKLLLWIAANYKNRRTLKRGEWITARKLKDLGLVERIWPFPEFTEEGKKELANLV